MHRSKLAGFIVDCQTQDLRGASEFWGAALGMPVRHFAGEEGKTYMQLVDSTDKLHIEVQTVTHPSRVHLDIESDDVEAEVQRLEKLGAVRVVMVKDWWVMEAPTGHRFCVIPSSSTNFGERARQWP